jgi:hypothetical protein
MTKFAELEIALRRLDAGAYPVELRFSPADSDADERFPKTNPASANIDFDALKRLKLQPNDYGVALGKALFQNEEIKAGFEKARNATRGAGALLRVRLFVDPGAPKLHEIRWESLRDAAGEALFNGERIVFSRYLSSAEWNPVTLRPSADLKALVVIANPAGLGNTDDPEIFDPNNMEAEVPKLAPVAVDAELRRAQDSLLKPSENGGVNISITALASGGSATLSNVITKLRDGYDILYLACHGALMFDGEPRLWLEDDKGGMDVVTGSDLARQIRELPNQPRLVVLASCQSAGTGKTASGTLSALGPRLADAGVPAVVAMQGNVTMDTIAQFMPAFFAELKRDGQIDRAMGRARGRVAARDDYWMPVLFMRLRSGRIWYVPGFDSDKSESDIWKPICDAVNGGQCVPILGPDLAAHLVGNVRKLASDIADSNSVPMSLQDRQDLAKVAQFVAIRSSVDDARKQVRSGLLSAMRQSASQLKECQGAAGGDPPSLMKSIVAAVAGDENDPLRIVAALGAKVFVTANGDPLLEMLLAQCGKPPVPIVTKWRDERESMMREDKRLGNPGQAPGQAEEFFGDPAPDKPLLYYVFGKSQMEDTWVLTEDDIYDYLIQTTRYKLMPTVIRSSLTDGSLFFLGFHLDDWKFRVLFRMILSIPGSFNLTRYYHVGVQVEPDETTISNARRVREYLESYFRKPNPLDSIARDPKIDIFWGTAADFLRQLKDQLKKQPVEAATKW